MVDVYCPNCGNVTNELYADGDEWICLSCLLDRHDKAVLSAWTDQDFENAGVQRVDEEAEE